MPAPVPKAAHPERIERKLARDGAGPFVLQRLGVGAAVPGVRLLVGWFLRDYARCVAEEKVLIERDAVPVMFKRVADEGPAIERGMAEMEELIGLHCRHY